MRRAGSPVDRSTLMTLATMTLVGRLRRNGARTAKGLGLELTAYYI